MRIIGNDQKNNRQNFWEILERIIGKISSIIGAGLIKVKLRLSSISFIGHFLTDKGLAPDCCNY